jgi:hypothetical protein
MIKTKAIVPRRNRDDFAALVLREIAHEVGHRCSNPDCQTPTSGPSKQKGVSNVGVGAHITAAAPGGPRFDPALTPAQRKSAANAIWLCNSCGRLVDNDASTYTVGELVKWKLDAIDRAQKALASGGRSTTEHLFAAHLKVQEQALAQQRESHDAQMREQQRSKFSEMYSRFLQEAKAYADAIDAYWTWMHKSAFRPDRPTREAKQKPVKDAYDAMQRALQPILLGDEDKTRGTLRWELLRRRALEPVIDTIENQEAYAAVIHYQQLRLLDGINQLQSNVRQALGLAVSTRSAQQKEFEEQMLERAKLDAEAVKAKIKAQFEKLMRERQARVGANAAVPSTPKEAAPNVTGSDIRNQVWNVLHVEIYEDDEEDDRPERRGRLTLLFLREIWRDVMARPIDEVPNNFVTAWQQFRQLLMSCADKTFYAIVEHAGRVPTIRDELNKALERSRAPYRFVDKKLLPAASEQEVAAIEAARKAVAGPTLATVRAHLDEAAKILGNRDQPNDRNSIKESISAIEALVAVVLGRRGTLGDLMRSIDDKLPDETLHPALKSALSKLYGYTSDAGGIRHALADEHEPDIEDAQFMLAICAAFVSLIVAKAGKRGLALL